MDDLKILVDGILDTAPNYSYTTTTHSCPFCREEEYGNDYNDNAMEDIKHKEYCLYLKALEIENNNFEMTKDEITFQITVTDNNDWEGEDFSFVINDVTEEYYNTLLHRSKKHENLSVMKTEFTKENVELVNKTSNNTYMDRFYILDFIPDLSNCDNIYEDLFYKGVGVV